MELRRALVMLVTVHCASSAPDAPARACAASAPTYWADVRPVLERRCFACHAGAGEAADEHDFAQIGVVRAQLVALVANVETRSMPPDGQPPLEDTEAALLLRWAACGARER